MESQRQLLPLLHLPVGVTSRQDICDISGAAEIRKAFQETAPSTKPGKEK